MRLRPEQLETHLEGHLAPAYLICGDEPLLLQESADAVRTAARRGGFNERELFHADSGFDWQVLLTEANALSLFAEKKILEVRSANGKPGDKGSNVIVEYCANPSGDNLLLVIAPKLDNSALKSKWVKAIDSCGVIVQVWPVNAAQLPRWIETRLQRAGIRASRAAVDILAERVEGNLLAAMQEIEKLLLLAPEAEVDATTMSTVVADSARYNLFSLVDKILEADTHAAAKILRGLKDEGSEPTVVLWALTRELRILIGAALAHSRGESIEDALQKSKVWVKRMPLLKSALRRLKPGHLRVLLRQAGGVDRAVKGLQEGDPWDELTALVLSFAGSPILNGESTRLALGE